MTSKTLGVGLAALVAAIIALTPSGCASSGSNYNEAKVSEIKKGQTTESELVAMFGEETNRSVDSNGNVSLQWTYFENRVNGKTFIPFAGSFLGGTDTKQKFLIATLNPEGTVESFQSSSGGMGTRGHTQSKDASTAGSGSVKAP